jgi:ribonuclease P protein component
VGLVVGRKVGSAVQRNRVKRRLRHLVRPHLSALPAASTVVLRALPGAAERSPGGLAEDLDRSLARLGVRA